MKDTVERNVALIERLYERVMGNGDEQAALEIWSADLVDHDVPGVGVGGRDDVMAQVRGVRAAIPDIRPVIDHTFGQDDLVCVRVTASGSHSGLPFPQGSNPRASRSPGTRCTSSGAVRSKLWSTGACSTC